jgi:hypothetical protein
MSHPRRSVCSMSQVSRTDECPCCGLQAFVTYSQGFVEELATPVFEEVVEVRCTNLECAHYVAGSPTASKGKSATEATAPIEAMEPRGAKWTKRQRDAFTRREGEDDALEWVARTQITLPLRELPRLLMTRYDDRKQVEAIQLLAELKMVKWTRALTFGTLALGVCTIVAAFIVR